MDAALTLSKLRAAMVVGDFDFRNNGAPLTALPAILTTLNATYTRNSAKNVVQNGALVSLSANQFGTSYDPVAATYGYVPEPAATNLATNSDGNASTYNTTDQVADGTAVPLGFTNGIAFGNNSVQRRATKSVSMTTGTVYSVSLFIIMDDGGAPVIGSSITTGDFCIIAANNIASPTLTRLIGSNVYRISGSSTATATALLANGIIKYVGQSARTFRITGIQVETGLRATSYIATTGSTASRSADVLTAPLWINNVKDSQGGSTANWTRGNSSVTTSGAAPDGTATAQLVTATASGVVTFFNNSIKAPAGTVTYSVYVKQGNKATCPLILRNSTTATNFTQGVLTFATGAITGAGWTVTNEGGGWFRCKYTQSTGISVGDTLSAFVGFAGSGADVLSDNVYFWGAQIEAGSVATAYRPTTSTLESAANANIAGFSSAGYTLAVDQRMDTTLTASTGALELSDLTSANRSLLFASGGTTATISVSTASVSQANTSFGSLGLTRKKMSASVRQNNVLSSLSGTAGTPDTSATMPAGLLFLHIGAVYNGSIQYNGYLFRAQLIPQAFTQAQINGLTT